MALAIMQWSLQQMHGGTNVQVAARRRSVLKGKRCKRLLLHLQLLGDLCVSCMKRIRFAGGSKFPRPLIFTVHVPELPEACREERLEYTSFRRWLAVPLLLLRSQ